MTNEDVLSLANFGMCPFVMSFACDTGAYKAYEECFAEAWLRRGDNAGAIAVLASSQDTYWEEDDVFERAVFEALFEDEERLLGDAVLDAKQSYLAYYGPSSETRQYFEQYNLFGDPTLRVVTRPIDTSAPTLLSIRLIDGDCVLTWAAGRLLCADCSLGPWKVVDGATSPWTNAPSKSRTFYRLTP